MKKHLIMIPLFILISSSWILPAVFPIYSPTNETNSSNYKQPENIVTDLEEISPEKATPTIIPSYIPSKAIAQFQQPSEGLIIGAIILLAIIIGAVILNWSFLHRKKTQPPDVG